MSKCWGRTYIFAKVSQGVICNSYKLPPLIKGLKSLNLTNSHCREPAAVLAGWWEISSRRSITTYFQQGQSCNATCFFHSFPLCQDREGAQPFYPPRCITSIFGISPGPGEDHAQAQPTSEFGHPLRHGKPKSRDSQLRR